MTTQVQAPMRRRRTAGDDLIRVFHAVREDLLITVQFVLGNHDDAQDAVQEAFLKCWRRRRQLAGVRNLRAWIYRVGMNAAKDLQRNAWRRRARPLTPALCLHHPVGLSPSDILLHDETQDRLRRALRETLTETQAAYADSRLVGSVEGKTDSDSRISTCASSWTRARSSSTGSEPMLCVPKTTSTQGALRVISPRSFCARQPPTAICMPGLRAFTGARWPRLP